MAPFLLVLIVPLHGVGRTKSGWHVKKWLNPVYRLIRSSAWQIPRLKRNRLFARQCQKRLCRRHSGWTSWLEELMSLVG